MKNIGFCMLLAFGSWGGVYITKGHKSFRVCLGWFAVTIFLYDVENAMSKIIETKEP